MISVALCTFNGEKYIREQINSILNQTMRVDEIVLCDDLSTDNTVSIVHELADYHPTTTFRIEVNEKRLGVSLNFEKALHLCSGDIKFLSDQDDIWMPEKVAAICDYFQSHPDKDVVFTNAWLINEDGKIISEKKIFDCVGLDSTFLNKATHDSYMDLFLVENRATGATMAIKNTVNVFFNYPTTILHDYILAIEALTRNSLGIINVPLIKYRIHSSQTLGLGEALQTPWSNNFFDLAYEDFDGYPLPDVLHEKIQMRQLRYKWIGGMKGVLSIIRNWRKYKKTYPTNWNEFMSYDISQTINHFQSRHQNL